MLKSILLNALSFLLLSECFTSSSHYKVRIRSNLLFCVGLHLVLISLFTLQFSSRVQYLILNILWTIVISTFGSANFLDRLKLFSSIRRPLNHIVCSLIHSGCAWLFTSERTSEVIKTLLDETVSCKGTCSVRILDLRFVCILTKIVFKWLLSYCRCGISPNLGWVALPRSINMMAFAIFRKCFTHFIS